MDSGNSASGALSQPRKAMPFPAGSQRTHPQSFCSSNSTAWQARPQLAPSCARPPWLCDSAHGVPVCWTVLSSLSHPVKRRSHVTSPRLFCVPAASAAHSISACFKVLKRSTHTATSFPTGILPAAPLCSPGGPLPPRITTSVHHIT